ncbi:MAG TPA: 5-methyltetrahydropteroyltriglutamate--homocysteine methyltransferase, partial [Candidatus Binatia bacterium]
MAARYRADHIGSLLRPAELLEARSANVSSEQLRALEDKHILRVIERQKEIGFKIFTDGELRRGNFMSDFNDA